MLHIIFGNVGFGFGRGNNLSGQDKNAIVLALGFVCVFICSKKTGNALMEAAILATKGKSMAGMLKEVSDYKKCMSELKDNGIRRGVEIFQQGCLEYQNKTEKAYQELHEKENLIRELETTIKQLKRLNNEIN